MPIKKATPNKPGKGPMRGLLKKYWAVAVAAVAAIAGLTGNIDAIVLHYRAWFGSVAAGIHIDDVRATIQVKSYSEPNFLTMRLEMTVLKKFDVELTDCEVKLSNQEYIKWKSDGSYSNKIEIRSGVDSARVAIRFVEYATSDRISPDDYVNQKYYPDLYSNKIFLTCEQGVSNSIDMPFIVQRVLSK